MNTTKKQGFTIIEVVLVLAIAGLIFLLVFIALPALQRNQRDDQRKREVARVLAQVNSYSSNNKGQLPKIDDSFAKYLDASGGFVAGNNGASSKITLSSQYVVVAGTANTSGVDAADNNTITLYPAAKCGDQSKAYSGGSTRQMAANIQLENGNGANYCQDI